MSEAATHVFRIALQDEPSVFREVEIPSAKQLASGSMNSRAVRSFARCGPHKVAVR